jgi:hypothetical protein
MKLKEIKKWIETLPKEFLEFEVMNAEIGDLTEDGQYTYRLDKPVSRLDVDVDNKEIIILNDDPKK